MAVVLKKKADLRSRPPEDYAGELGITARKALADYQATPNLRTRPPSIATQAAFSSRFEQGCPPRTIAAIQ
jgi:hypothetical protein